MIIDFNAGIGTWPFRPLKYGNIDNLVKLMKKLGIDRAVVNSISNVFYKDCLIGNKELIKQIKPYGDIFIPFATVNPAFPGWLEDLQFCIKELKMQGLKLYPSYHNYRLTDANCSKLIEEATKLKLPLMIMLRIEDERQHHWLCKVPPVDLEQVEFILKEFPQEATFIFGAVWTEWSNLADIISQHPNAYIEISSLKGPINVLEKLVRKLGASKILFGTNLPYFYPLPSILKVEKAKITKGDKEKIFSGNARRILGRI